MKEKLKLLIEFQPRERNLQFLKTDFFFNETQPSENCFNRFRFFFTVSLLERIHEFTNTHPATDPQGTSNLFP